MVMPADSASASHALPLLSVVRGEPTPAELAAVTVVLGAMSRAAAVSDRLPLRSRLPVVGQGPDAAAAAGRRARRLACQRPAPVAPGHQQFLS